MTVNVKDHGALGDGDTNDVAAIQAAIAAAVAAGGDVVFFPSGSYSVRGTISGDTALLTVGSGIALEGEGPTSRLFCEVERVGTPAIPFSQRAYLFYGDGVSDVAVRRLALESTNEVGTAVDEAIRIRGTDGAPCRNVAIEGCEFSGFRVAAFASRGGRRADGSGVLSSLRILDCDIRTIGRMAGGDDGVVFGVGINANGWDGAYIARNHIENVGIGHTHWGMYCNLTRFAAMAENTVVDCSGGIAWTGIETAFGQEAVTIVGNTIDLARDLDDDWELGAGEAPFAEFRIGLQLRGDNADTPVQVGVVGNRLRAANIQVSAQNAVITGNEVDLASLKTQAGIWVGWLGTGAHNVTVSENTIRAASRPDEMTTGILVSNGSDIRVVRNHIMGTAIGMGVGVGPDPEAPLGRVVNGQIDRNTITLSSSPTAIKNYFFYINGSDHVAVSENACEATGFKRHAVQIGDNNRPQDNRSVWISRNEFRYLGGADSPAGAGGVTFGVGLPPDGAPLPRFIRLEDNRSEFSIVNWPPNCPHGWRYTVFEEGDVLRANWITGSGLDEGLAYPDPCGRSSLLHGAANAERPLRAHEVGGQRVYSVLGGHAFTAPLGASCPWRIGLVGEHEQCAAPDAGADDAGDIAVLADGFVGQVVAIRAQGAPVWIRDQSDVPTGNITLRDGASWRMGAGERLRLVRLDDRWQELDRGELP